MISAIDQLTTRIAQEQDSTVPRVDRDGPKERARVLLVLQDPGVRGALTSGVLSASKNAGKSPPDQTADNEVEFMAHAGLDEKLCVFWNGVPWGINPVRTTRVPNASEEKIGAGYLRELLALLPELRAVVAMGGTAKSVCRRAKVREWPGLTLIETWHPGPLAANRVKNKPELLEKHYLRGLREAAQIAQRIGV